MKKSIAVLLLVFLIQFCFGQEPDVLNQVGGRLSNFKGNTSSKDTLGFQHRDDSKDSIAISFKFLDSIRSIPFDSTINDFDKYFSVPSSYLYLGNNGAAAIPLIFSPNTKPGFDAGFHAFDIYRYTLEQTKFYKTNRPFTQLNYQLASGKEQMIKALHTQNPRPNLGFGFDYRLISSPGFFVTQNSNHKSYRLFSNYQGKRKRYAANFVMLGNNIRNSENGGITNDSLLKNPNHKKRHSVPVNLGNANLFEPNPFLTAVSTGNIYKDFSIFIRQSYDIGKKDSIAINDSTTEYLFYPKLRAQHSFTYNTQHYLYKDDKADSTIYKNWYNITLRRPLDSFYVQDKWSIIRNDFSLLQFPDTKNSGQFLQVGATLENIKGELKTGTRNFYNTIIHGEYRNKTRNKLWDVLAKVEFYTTGLNSGDYSAFATIGRHVNKNVGDIRLFFKNTNRTPSFIFNDASSFNLSNPGITQKENIISFGAEFNNQFMNLAVKNHILTNYTYFSNLYQTTQSSKLINLLQVNASKKIRLSKKWHWYADVTAQLIDGSAPIKLPLLFTRSRLAYEGIHFKNLSMSAGLEVRYFTPFEANNYSPVMGQFTPQDSFKLKNLPDIHAFFHFRIKGFVAYIRAENLNTVSFTNGFGFINNNFAAPHYPTQGFIFRFGIQWAFVN